MVLEFCFMNFLTFDFLFLFTYIWSNLSFLSLDWHISAVQDDIPIIWTSNETHCSVMYSIELCWLVNDNVTELSDTYKAINFARRTYQFQTKPPFKVEQGRILTAYTFSRTVVDSFKLVFRDEKNHLICLRSF